jgi:hypothetical protein
MESSADQRSGLPLLATATRNACSGKARVTIGALIITPSQHYVKSTPGFSLLLASRQVASFDKPLTSAASGTVNDIRI